jgi:hypothetical protein
MKRCRPFLAVAVLAAVTVVGIVVYRRDRSGPELEPPF